MTLKFGVEASNEKCCLWRSVSVASGDLARTEEG